MVLVLSKGLDADTEWWQRCIGSGVPGQAGAWRIPAPTRVLEIGMLIIYWPD